MCEECDEPDRRHFTWDCPCSAVAAANDEPKCQLEEALMVKLVEPLLKAAWRDNAAVKALTKAAREAAGATVRVGAPLRTAQNCSAQQTEALSYPSMTAARLDATEIWRRVARQVMTCPSLSHLRQ